MHTIKVARRTGQRLYDQKPNPADLALPPPGCLRHREVAACAPPQSRLKIWCFSEMAIETPTRILALLALLHHCSASSWVARKIFAARSARQDILIFRIEHVVESHIRGTTLCS